MRMTWLAVLGLAACAEPMVMTQDPVDATVERELLEVEGFGANPGDVRLFLYTPRQPKPGTGLVVALHGCLQSAADYQRAGWNALAEARGFYVLYVQSSAANGCFRWFEPAHATRGQGEVASVVSGVDWVLQRYAVDRRRVFVTGLSAGAGLSAALLASAPDVFSAGALFAGVPAGCATTSSEGLTCMRGVDLSPAEWASRARASWSGTGAVPRVQIWTGESDPTVSPKMATELVEQFTALHGLSATPVEREQVARVSSSVFGRGEVQLVTVRGFGHAVPVAVSAGCGSTGPFITEAGVCGAREAARFFGLLDTPAPDPVELLDAGVPPEEPAVDAGVALDGGVACRESYVTPTWHVWMWHADVCGFFSSLACARGSSELLGSTYSALPVWASSLDGETWRAGRCE